MEGLSHAHVGRVQARWACVPSPAALAAGGLR